MVPHVLEEARPLRPCNFSSSSRKGVFQQYRPKPESAACAREPLERDDRVAHRGTTTKYVATLGRHRDTRASRAVRNLQDAVREIHSSCNRSVGLDDAVAGQLDAVVGVRRNPHLGTLPVKLALYPIDAAERLHRLCDLARIVTTGAGACRQRDDERKRYALHPAAPSKKIIRLRILTQYC